MFDFLGRKSKRESEKILQKYELQRVEKEKDGKKLRGFNKIFKEIVNVTKVGNIIILNVEYNPKIDQHVLVYRRTDEFQIYVKAPGIRSSSTGIPTNIRLLVTNNIEENSIFIEDIQTGEDTSKGFGRIALSHLISEAKKYKIARITGRMVYDNLDHKKRQTEYYSKLGFTIKNDSLLLKLI